MNIIDISVAKFTEIGDAISEAVDLPISKYLRGRFNVDEWLIEHKLMMSVTIECVMGEGLTYSVAIENDALALQFKLTYGI